MRADTTMVFFQKSRTAIVHVRPPQVQTREKTGRYHTGLVMGMIVVQRDPPGRWFTWRAWEILRIWLLYLKRPYDRVALKVLLRRAAWRNARRAGTTFETEDLADPIFGAKSARTLVREYLVKVAGVLDRADESAAKREDERRP